MQYRRRRAGLAGAISFIACALAGAPVLADDAEATAPVYDLRTGDRLSYHVSSRSSWSVHTETREVREVVHDPLETSFDLDADVLGADPSRITLGVKLGRGSVAYEGPGIEWKVELDEAGLDDRRAFERALKQRPEYGTALSAAEVASIDEQSIGLGLALLAGRLVVASVRRDGSLADVLPVPEDVLARFPEPDRPRVERLLQAHLARAIGLLFPAPISDEDAARFFPKKRRSKGHARPLRHESRSRPSEEPFWFTGTRMVDQGGRTRFDPALAWGPSVAGDVTRTDELERLRGSGIVSRRVLDVQGEGRRRVSEERLEGGVRRITDQILRSRVTWRARLIRFGDGGGEAVSP